MGVFPLFVSFVVFLWACVGLIHPQTARIPNRAESAISEHSVDARRA